MTLLDMMIRNGRMQEFTNELIKLRNDEQEEKAIWELWLHKVFDESFADFKMKLLYGTVKDTPKKEEIEATVANSFKMLEGFVPEGMNEDDGTVSTIGNGGG